MKKVRATKKIASVRWRGNSWSNRQLDAQAAATNDWPVGKTFGCARSLSSIKVGRLAKRKNPPVMTNVHGTLPAPLLITASASNRLARPPKYPKLQP